MDKFIEKILRKNKIKITKIRQKMADIFANEKRPVSAYEIWEKIGQENIKSDLATVYRNLEMFCRLNILTKTQFEENLVRYEIKRQDHHHHLVCKTCGVISDVKLDEKFIDKIESESKFKVEKHLLEFFGVCVNCQL